MGVEFIILAALTVAAGLLSYLTLKKPEEEVVFKDQKPSTTVQRGAYIPRLVGRRRVGPSVLWVGTRSWQNVKKQGGKILTWFEARWDAVCIGPAEKLHRIVRDGEVLFEGPIDRINTPSGTRIQTGDLGAFRIWWGEQVQPVNLCLALVDELQGGWSDGVGISSRWPYLCYIYWEFHDIGFNARWPLLEYEMEVRPVGEGSNIASAPAWIEGDRTLLTDPRFTFEIHTGVAPPGGSITIYSDTNDSEALDALQQGRFVKLSGTVGIDGDHEIATVTRVDVDHDGSIWTPTKRGAILTFADDAGETGGAGTCQPYTEPSGDGANPIVVWDELMFGPFPHGAGLPIDEISVTSMEAAAQAVQVEGLACSVLAKDGKELKTITAELLQDIGYAFPLDTVSGLYRLFALRNTADPNDIFQIVEEMMVELPEIETLHADKPVNRIIYVYEDRERSFRDMTITIDDDGEAQFLEHVKARKVPIRIFIQFDTAAKVAERRSQEDLAGAGKASIIANRSARKFYPGLPVSIEGVSNGAVQRIIGVTVDPLKGKCKIDVIPDFLGVETPAFTNRDSDEGKEPPVRSPQPDRLFYAMEVPSFLNTSGLLELMVPRIRDHDGIFFADIYHSSDDTTYFSKGREFDIHTGGLLEAELPATGPTLSETGPTIQIMGVDADVAQDLSGDTAAWLRGDQWCVFKSGGAVEICYLRELVNLGGGQYRLDGLLRGRLATKQLTHPIGTGCIIFARDEIEILVEEDADFVLDQLMYVKTVPYVGELSVDINDVTADTVTLKSVGIQRPFDTSELQAGSKQVNNEIAWGDCFETGDDIDFKWVYKSTEQAGTGAGFQGAGDAVGSSPVQGEFVITFKTTGDVVKRTVTGLTTPSYTYTNANLVADFGSEQTFKAEVKQLYNGFESTPEEITVTLV